MAPSTVSCLHPGSGDQEDCKGGDTASAGRPSRNRLPQDAKSNHGCKGIPNLGDYIQSWALPVFFHFFNNKK